MSNVYSAQNVAAYLIYELNDVQAFVNSIAIQHLLADVNLMWQRVFGHGAFSEVTLSMESGYVVKEVVEAYEEHGSGHIFEPAKEWYLKYGEFQLILRPYGIPAYKTKEQLVMSKVIDRYRSDVINIAV